MAAPGMDQFDMYFRRADLDGDGRISGAEAVSFFQGSNLPKHVLAQIWMHADQGHTGFLGRAEFYNALRLVTVAQSKRELTPDIVKAALYGPAAAKIPAPKINLPATSVPQSNSVAAASAPTAQMGLVAPAASPNVGFGGKVGPNASMNHQYFPAQQNNLMRPTQVTSTPAALPPSQGIANPELARGGVSAGPHISNSNISHDWLSGNVGATSQVPIRGPGSSMPSTVSPRDLLLTSQSATKDSKASAVSGNGFTSGPNFGGDVFSPFASQPNQGLNALSNSRASSSSATVLVCSESQASLKSQSFDSLQSGFTFRPAGGQFQRPPMYLSSDPQGRAHITSVPSSAMPVGGGSSVSSQPASGELQRPPMHSNSNQQAWAQSTSIASSRAPVGVANSVSNQTQLSWSKMKPSDVQKYTKVFLEVDSDKDGRITGQQARNLFLSWRLPREVLKQVWDLSDQDNDSMLSLREFCIALYLMERYREGCSLPTVLPSSVMYDETLLSMTGQGLRYQQGLPVAQPMTSASPLSPSLQAAHTSQTDGSMQSNQQRPEQLLSRDPFADFGKEVQSSQNTRSQEATEADKKVEGTGKMILDSREKIEFFHKKMQELVLYKSRCDNRLNEITERASADKREAESLAKKYEEKYKQVAEIASKLTVEEAKFHDTQERKMELQQAIVNMERGGSSDGILQVRVDRIQSDLDELMKALSERCKKHSVHVKSTARVELPIGWQSGIQEGAAEWDEDWDKFEDEGFSLVTDLRANVQNDMASQKENSASPSHVLEAESACAHSEDDGLGRSPPDSPAERMYSESSPHKFSNAHSGKSTETDTETNRSFDESTWGAFDNHDDTDSVWGFNPSIRDSDTEKHRDHDFFGSDNLGAISVRTSDIFQKRSPFSFDDSVPSTPLSKFGNSPRYSEAGDHFFDNMSRFDSFATREGGLSPRRENLTRFDSINSTADFGHGGSFTFDDSDPFGSTGPFKATSEGQNSRRETGNWGGF